MVLAAALARVILAIMAGLAWIARLVLVLRRRQSLERVYAILVAEDD